MARDFRSTQHSQSIDDSSHVEWMDLRDQLEDLLDEVTRQQHDNHDTESRAHMNPSPRRPQAHGAVAGSSDRHVAALKNVRSAVNRFADMEEAAPMPPRSRNDIDAAVEQIRSSRSPSQSRRNWEDGVDHESRRHESRPLNDRGLSRRQLEDRRDYAESRRRDDYAGSRDHARFEQLDASIGEITDYLSRFDDLISSDRLSGGHLSEITVQLEQMTSIVEVLASKVNERGQFDTIERQIATLHAAVEQGGLQKSEGLEGRLGVLSESFERLSAIQAEQSQHTASAYNELLSRTSSEKSSEHYGAIEDGVRNIYERLDAMSSGDSGAKDLQDGLRGIFNRIEQLEQNVSAPTPLLQRLTNDITDLSSTLKSAKAPVVSSVISTRIDSLNDRISSVENANERAPSTLDMSAINTQLNETLNQALTPRLAEIETKIGGIANGMKSRAVKLESSPQLEQQIRTLTEKLEQTSADLAQLRESGTTSQAELPDLDALADLVAQRTKGAIARVQNSANGATKEMFGNFETRISGLLEKAGEARPQTDLSSIETGIQNVNARLMSLEKSVKGDSFPPENDWAAAPTFSPASSAGEEPSNSSPNKSSRPSHPGLAHPGLAHPGLAHPGLARMDAQHEPERQVGGRSKNPSARQHLLPELQDTMPKAPSNDGPLNAPAFPNQADDPEARADFDSSRKRARKVPVPDVLKSSMGLGLEDEHSQEQAKNEARENFDAQSDDRPNNVAPVDLSNVATPPTPRSSFAFDGDDDLALSGSGEGGSQGEVSDFAKDARSDFENDAPSTPTSRVEPVDQDEKSVSRSTFIAAARRAAQANNAEVSEQASTSLFGRAFSRFQKNKTQVDEIEADGFANEPQAFDDSANVNEPDEGKPRLGRFHKARAAKKQAAADQRAAESEAAAQISEQNSTNELREFSYDEELDINAQNESVLTRYRRPILLGLATIAVSLLALNLVSQRLGEATSPEVVEAAAPVAIEQIASPEPAATNIDTNSVGSIEQLIVTDGLDDSSNLMINSPTTTSPVRMIDPSLFLDMPVSLESASLSSSLATSGLSTGFTIDDAVGPAALRDAAASGDVFAQFEVAAIYADGTSVTRDMQKARDWYLRSAEQGFAPAMYLLANMLENGTGIEKNVEQAAFWYERGAELGNRMSMHNLAAMNASGALGDQNFDMAAKWFERAAALGLTDSQFNLGMLNARGLGVPQDLNTSYKWFSIAAFGGDADAQQAKVDVARSLDAPIVGQLDAQIQDWTPQELNVKANFAPIGTWSTDFDPGASIDNQAVIQRVQAALNKLGYDAGIADGLIGPKTREAIGLFEQATGMSSSNEINPRLLAVLGSQPV